jgi:hypothetical protein
LAVGLFSTLNAQSKILAVKFLFFSGTRRFMMMNNAERKLKEKVSRDREKAAEKNSKVSMIGEKFEIIYHHMA